MKSRKWSIILAVMVVGIAGYIGNAIQALLPEPENIFTMWVSIAGLVVIAMFYLDRKGGK